MFRKDHQLFRTTCDLLQFPGDQVLELLDLCVQSIGLGSDPKITTTTWLLPGVNWMDKVRISLISWKVD